MGYHSKQHIKIKDDIKELQAQNRQLRNELTQKPSPLIDNSVREWKCHAGGINCSSGETPLVKDRANHSYSNMYLNSYYQIIQLSSYRLKHYCILLNLHIALFHTSLQRIFPLELLKTLGKGMGEIQSVPLFRKRFWRQLPLKSGGQGGVQGLQHLLTPAKNCTMSAKGVEKLESYIQTRLSSSTYM